MERAIRLAVAAIIIAILVGMTGLGINKAIQEQPNLRWIYAGAALLASASGFSIAMVITSHLHRCFQIEVEEEEKKVGRLLSELEMRRIGKRFREKRQQGGTNVSFPLQRLVARFLLLLPAVILSSFVVIVGAFLSGFLLAGLIEEYRKRTLPYF